ncbi:MAG: hypothetical protein IPP88_02325 [Betaproteobacteria bacterium]|nr:hypothetical protein [Betaproteobacteria bacterium]
MSIHLNSDFLFYSSASQTTILNDSLAELDFEQVDFLVTAQPRVSDVAAARFSLIEPPVSAYV